MAMPTLQQIIGTITGKVAFERTQANFTTIKDVHDGLETNLETHKAESVAYSIGVNRDLSLAGTQMVSLPFKAKSITCVASVNGTQQISWGIWGENAYQRVVAITPSAVTFSTHIGIAALKNTGTIYATALIQNVTENGFEINWVKTGEPTGTASLYIIAVSHGGA